MHASCLTFGINLLVDDSFYIHGLTSNIIIIPVHEVLDLTSGAIWRGLFGKMATAALEELTGKLVSCWRIFVERRKSVTKTLLALTLERSLWKQAWTTKEVKGNLLSWLEEWRELEREMQLTEAGRPLGYDVPCKEISKVC